VVTGIFLLAVSIVGSVLISIIVILQNTKFSGADEFKLVLADVSGCRTQLTNGHINPVFDSIYCLWAWWEVVAAHHLVHDYACCHLQADCLESGISSGPLRSITSMGNLYLFYCLLLDLKFYSASTGLLEKHFIV